MFLHLTIFLLIAVKGCFSQTACSPTVDCSAGVVLDKVADPDSCTQFYVCVLVDGAIVPSDAPFQCAAGEYFDPTLGACAVLTGGICHNTCVNYCSMLCDASIFEGTRVAYPGEVDRYYLCVGTLPVETLCPVSDPFFNGNTCVADASDACNFCFPFCIQAGMQVQDPIDCRRYYVCAGTGSPDWSLHGTCADGQIFNPTTARCVDGATCTNMCTF